MNGFPHTISALLSAVFLLFGTMVPARDITTIFAAASLKNALDAVVSDYDSAVTVSYGGSAIMARQVALGAPADVVILANETWMDWLEARGVIGVDERVELLGNALVVVGPTDDAPLIFPLDATQLLARLRTENAAMGRLAIGQTTGVPAGIYGRAWLQSAGLWADVEGHLAEVENVRVALAFVARKETPLGVVYASDALAEPRVTVVYNVPSNMHPPIIYPAASITEKGKSLLAFLQTSHASTIFETHGFIPLMGQN